MTEENSLLSKICSICGLQKPLTAYMQWQEGVGATYGAVCADCRKAGLDKEKKDRDDTTVSSSGNKIDAKAKVAADIDKQKQHHDSETEYFKEREENALDVNLQSEKNQRIAQSEKSHREEYLRTKSFLDQRNKVLGTQPTVFGGEAERAKEAKIDLTVAPIDTQIAGKVKFQTGEFNRFKTLLGGSAPIARGEQKGKEAVKQFIEEKWDTSPTRKR